MERIFWHVDEPVPPEFGTGVAAPWRRGDFVVVGDSHSSQLAVAGGGYVSTHLLCAAGSARGLGNPKSISGYGGKLIDWFSLNRVNVPIFLQFGQVDTEFVWVYRRIRAGERRYSPHRFVAFADESIAGYRAFLSALLPRVDRRLLHLCTVFPPAIADATWARGYGNAHIASLEDEPDAAVIEAAVREIEVPRLRERTRLHGLFNLMLLDLADDIGAGFVDLFSPLVHPVSGTLDSARFITHGGTDHHLSQTADTTATLHAVLRGTLKEFSLARAA